MSKSKPEGGMNKNWISQIFRSSDVQGPLDKVATAYKNKLEAVAKSRFGNENRYGYHYGQARIGAGWTRVAITFPITPSARAHPELLDKPDGTVQKGG